MEPETMQLPLGITPDSARVLMAVGTLVQVSASAESTLRTLYCALVGSKYATVTAAGQGNHWLVTECRNLLREHTELTVEQREMCTHHLNELRAAYLERNLIVHAPVAQGPDGRLTLLQSQRGKSEWQQSELTAERVDEAISRMRAAASELSWWIYPVLGIDAATIEAQLRWEAYLLTLSDEEITKMRERRGAAKAEPEPEGT